jgi:hypothetical protein
MGKKLRLTESELHNVIRRIIEQSDDEYYKISPEEYTVLASGKNYTGTFDIDTSNKKTLSLRYLSIPVMNQNKKIVYIIRVALSLRTMTFSMYNLKIILFIIKRRNISRCIYASIRYVFSSSIFYWFLSICNTVDWILTN